MKLQVTMKTPDALDEAIQEIVQSEMVYEIEPDSEDANDLLDRIDEDERERRINEIKGVCKRWFEKDEYLTVEIDTDAQTCVVVPCKERERPCR